MKILVTGSGGMVGRNLVSLLRAQGAHHVLEPRKAELDLLDRNATLDYLNMQRPDFVLHAAGRVGGIKANMENQASFFLENMLMGVNLFDACVAAKVERVINLSSSCIYPRDYRQPLVETDLFASPLEPTNEGYALAKLSVLRYGSFLSKENARFHCKTVIPPNLYGPWDKFDLQNAHLIPAVIRKIHGAMKAGNEPVEIWGDGSARREFMYVSDLCQFLAMALERFDSLPDLLNVGLSRDYSVKEYYECVAKLLGYRGEFKFRTDMPTGMKQKLLDSTLAHVWGWRPNYDLEDGLKATIKYFMEHCV